MATPQVIGNDQSLATQCLVFIQSLVNQRIGFNFNLTSGDFTCSFDSTGTVIAASARIPTDVKKKSSSPSTKRRNAKRRQLFLENKKRGSSYVDCENPAQSAREKPPLPACNEPPQNKKLGSSSVDCGKPPQSACEEPPQPAHKVPPQQSAHKEPTQPFSESLCFPSTTESADFEPNNHGGGNITKKMRLEKVPPLTVLVDARSSPKYRIQQFDGNSSLSDLSPCENDPPSEIGDDSKMDQSTYCPNCDTSTFHQCHDADYICDSMVILGDELYMDQSSICPHCEQTLRPNIRHGYFNCDSLCVRMSYLITQDLIEDLTFDPFMGPHNEKCENAREKRTNGILNQIECSTSDDDNEIERKYLSKKLCFCYDQRIYDF